MVESPKEVKLEKEAEATAEPEGDAEAKSRGRQRWSSTLVRLLRRTPLLINGMSS